MSLKNRYVSKYPNFFFCWNINFAFKLKEPDGFLIEALPVCIIVNVHQLNKPGGEKRSLARFELKKLNFDVFRSYC